MVWTARVTSAVPNSTPGDSFTANVKFSDGTREFTKSYNLSSNNCADELAVQRMLEQEIAGIEATYALMEALNAAPIDVVPNTVTNFQARATLVAQGLFDAADRVVHASGDPLAIQAWEYSNTFYRNSPLIQTMSEALGLDSSQVDDLFRQASQVVV